MKRRGRERDEEGEREMKRERESDEEGEIERD